MFRRWNELAGESDPKALALICAAPGTEDTYDSPITSYRAGFPVVRADGSGNKVPALHVGRNDENGSAVIDFTDPGTSTVGDEDDVYVSMVKERTGWKVCRVQITAAGGFG